MKKRHGVVISKTGLIIGLLSLSLVAIAGQAHAAIQCYDCHGDRQAGILKPKDTYIGAPKLRDEATGAFLGNHQTHLGAVPSAADCVKCHNNQNYTNSHASAGSFKIQINPKLNNFSTSLGAARYGKPASFDQTSVPVTATCSNVNCHFVSKPTDQWGTSPYASANTTTCNKCHDALPVSNAHTKHIARYGNDLTSCANCHTDHTVEAKPFQHATSAGRPIVITNTYTGSNNNYLPGTGPQVVGDCSNVYCHSSGQSLIVANDSTPVYKSVNWGATSSACSTELCHPTTKTSVVSGGHNKHLAATGVECVNCHAGVAADGSTYTGAAHVNQQINVESTLAYNAAASRGDGYGTCSTASCHDNGKGVPAVTPQWGSSGNGCTACHDLQPATGSHSKHLSSTLYAKAICGDCHNGAVQGITAPSTHMNATVDVFTNISGDLGYPTHSAKHNNEIYTGKGCTTAYCHSSGQSAIGGALTAGDYRRTPDWGTALSCDACHNVSKATLASGSHNKHLNAATPVTCDTCHAGVTVDVSGNPTSYNSTAHVNRQVNVVSGFGYNGTTIPGDGYGSCSTVSCHSDGKGGYATVTWGSSSSAGCGLCHPSISAAHVKHTVFTATSVYGSTADNSTDAAYDFGCGNCHPTAVSSHMNGAIDLTLNNTQGGTLKSKNNVAADNQGYTQTTGSSVTCSAAYCHSNGFAANMKFIATPDWYGTYSGDKCAMCHGNSPNSDTVNKPGSSAHSAHAVGIHYDDIFDGVSGKYGYYSSATKASAHGDPNQSTIISCDICHTDTVATAAAGKNANDKNSICVTCHSTTSRTPAIKRMAHINGTVDVKFASVNVRSKAQIRETSFSSYTSVWSRTSYKVDSGSYDTAKKSLTQATFTAAGVAGQGTCATVSCHNGYTVNWNDSLTCESCHSRL